MNLKEVLENQVKSWSAVGSPAILERFVLRNGREYTPQPFTGKRMTAKECFTNAAIKAYSDQTYVEGFAMREGIEFPIHHAWLADKGGNVIDPTWIDPEKCQYFGIPIDHEELWDELARTGFYSILVPGEMFNFEWMVQKDPGIKEWMK